MFKEAQVKQKLFENSRKISAVVSCSVDKTKNKYFGRNICVENDFYANAKHTELNAV